MSNQKQLFLSNRNLIDKLIIPQSEVMHFEQKWIEQRLTQCQPAAMPESYQQLISNFHTQLEIEKVETDSSSSDYVALSMSLTEFRTVVAEFAVDGLTEAQVFYYIIPRLPLSAQMPMLRIMIDEFGSGNLTCAHTTLYMKLLSELNMSTQYRHYINDLGDASFEFLNLFYWLCIRADDASWFVGALTYLETVIPDAFECFAQACHRLGLREHAYYTEHQHIDAFHAKESLRILQAMDQTNCLDYSKAWKGMLLASLITGTAFEQAVQKAHRLPETNIEFSE